MDEPLVTVREVRAVLRETQAANDRVVVAACRWLLRQLQAEEARAADARRSAVSNLEASGHRFAGAEGCCCVHH